MGRADIPNGEDNVVTRWARAWSTQDTPSFMNLFVVDARYCDVALDKVFRGQQAIRAFFEGTFTTFPDFKMEIVRSAVAADAAAGEWIMSGTFLGQSFGEPPTGKSFRVEGCCFMKLLDGRIVEHRDYWNPATFDQQVKI
ncbi:SgcJ/EcaC family oxidoreductase [Bradyrhizobium sp. SSUT18]|uniref:SgcJ/EcaC family oxidoreductase n=1 Tax=Bradyrhizobium sp. SSUT18 TaxID=3040602 RepID=UPI00244D17F9|nr:SgcJ/EcaC family oxidoreductase [Bradyrhizobium sp. SSUT18]MDH2401833.1 SgcJ/EcaC family oxidoreductase [Bradyrhizobium sp. SSUT18]